MLRNGVTPIPPATQSCRDSPRPWFVNEPNGPSTIASAPSSSRRSTLV